MGQIRLIIARTRRRGGRAAQAGIADRRDLVLVDGTAQGPGIWVRSGFNGRAQGGGAAGGRAPRMIDRCGDPDGMAPRPEAGAGSPLHGMDWPISFSISATAFWSAGATIVIAVPLRPARPVRPIRCP